MPDAFTGTAQLDWDTMAYDLLAYKPLRAELYFDGVATVKPTKQSHRGASVRFTFSNDLAVATAELAEAADVDAVAISNSNVDVVLREHGNTTKTTAKIRNTSYIELDPEVADLVGYNAGISLDTIARDVLVGGTNVRYGGNATSQTTVDAADILDADDIRRAEVDLAGANVMRDGGFYWAFIHNDVAYDLRKETGAGAWRTPREYVDPGDIRTGEMGEFEGFRFVKTPRAKVFENASNGGGLVGPVDVYATLFLGKQALAKAHSVSEGNGALPRIVPGPVTDSLRRFVPMGWYWFGGYSVFRQAALRRVESASSIGANV
jgi:N4-gp56 family major capsid protein